MIVLMTLAKFELFLTRLRAAMRERNFHLGEIRNLFFAGVVIAIPVIVTIGVLKIVYGFINGLSAPYLQQIFGHNIPGLGFIVTLALLILLGFMARNVLGKRILIVAENLLMRLPVVATIYAGVKQVVDSFKSFNNLSNFKRVVYVDYPGEGCKLIGFVTGQFFDSALQKEMISVVIPTAPNPMTGLVVIVEANRVIESSMTLEEATKFIVSAGMIAPRMKAADVAIR